MPRREEDNRQIRERQRANIAMAAARVFARRGLAATRISDIAAEAKVSQGLAHHYFESKDALFTELVQQVMTSAVEVPRLATQQPGTPLDQLRWYVEVVLMGVAQSPELMLLAWQAQAGEAIPSEAARLVRENGELGVRRLARLVSAAQATGEVRDGSPKAIATHLVACLQGLGLQMVQGPAPKGFPDIEMVMAMLTHGAPKNSDR